MGPRRSAASTAGSGPTVPSRHGRAPSEREPSGMRIRHPSDPALSPPPWLERLRRLRLSSDVVCPHCASERLHRWGRFSGRQRYRCLACGRTFSDFTGTPLHYLKRLDRWEAFCDLALASATIRSAAGQLELAPSTCFRWRHRWLNSLLASETTMLSGRASLGSTWIAHSEKGTRNLDRPARRRRFEGLSGETRSIWIIMACDEQGRSFGAVAGPCRPPAAHLASLLSGRVRRGTTLLSRRGELSAEAVAARTLGLRYGRERPAGRSIGRVRPEPARLHALRWRHWMRRFKGIATRYLENYLVWFRVLDVADGQSVRLRGRDISGALRAGRFPSRVPP
jgi:transposase-like protein